MSATRSDTHREVAPRIEHSALIAKLTPDTTAAVDIVWAEPKAPLTDASVDRTIAELESHLRRHRRYVLLFDLPTGLPNASQRKKLVAHMKTNAEAIEQWVRGVGVVLPSTLARGAIAALLWFAPNTVPIGMFATRAEARRWAESLGASPRRLS